MRFEVLDDFGYVLRVLAVAEENGVGGFDQDQIFHADGGDEFFGTPEVIPEASSVKDAPEQTFKPAPERAASSS